MKRSKIYAFATLMSSAILASCAVDLLPDDPHEDEGQQTETARLNLRLIRSASTKSSISPDEDAVNELCVIAYQQSDGRLTAVQTGKTAGDIDIELTEGDYNIYVTANMTGFEAPSDEKDMESACCTNPFGEPQR